MKTAKRLELASDPTEVGKFEGENFLKVALCFVIQDDRENCLQKGADPVPNESTKSVIEEGSQRIWIYEAQKHLPLFIVKMQK